MNILKKCNALLLIAMFITQCVSAQTDSTLSCVACICKNDLAPAGIMISHVHPKGEWMFSYRYMNMASRGMEQNGQSISSNQIYNQYLYSSDRMQMQMHMFMAMYAVSNKLTLMGMFEYDKAAMNMNGLPGMTMNMPGMVMTGNMAHDMKTSGFGDVSLTGLYSLLNSKRNHLLVSGGLSIPTGSIQSKGDAESMSPGIRYPYMMQQGSGTWDVLPGLTYTYKNDKVMASSQVSTIIRTGYNAVGYKLGNEVTFNNWVSYQWFKWFSTSLRGEFIQLGKMNGRDPSYSAYIDPSSNPMNYGGSTAYGYIGANFFFLNRNKVGFEVGLPVYQQTYGIQPKMCSSIHLVYLITF
jgi:hypothetical protein